MMNNEIPSLSIRQRSNSFIRFLRRTISTGLPSSSSNSLFKWEREKPLRLTLVINVYITTFRLLITSHRAKYIHPQDSILFGLTNLEVS